MTVGSLTALAILAGCSSGSQHRAIVPSTSGNGVVTSAPANPTSTCRKPGQTSNGSAPEVNVPGDIPDNQAFVTYQPPSGGYSIRVPEGWARAEQSSSATFTDKFNSIRLQVLRVPSVPTVASGQAEFGTLAASSACFQAGKVSVVSRHAGSALLITYRVDSSPDSVTGKVVHEDVERYEFWRTGTEVVVTLASSQGSDNVDPWRKVTDSFAWAA